MAAMERTDSYIGYALIVIVKYFKNPEDDRVEASVDRLHLTEAFKLLGFKINVVTDSDTLREKK